MRHLVIVNDPRDWPINVPGVEVVSSRNYLTNPEFNDVRHVRVFNLCRSYAYQALGYYVSLLAEARRHKPQPDVSTIQSMKSQTLLRIMTEDLDQLIQKSLRTVRADEFVLSIYFGQTMAKRDRRLGLRLFNLFPCPLLRAQFQRRNGTWQLQTVRPISAREIPEPHRPAVIDSARQFFERAEFGERRHRPRRYHLAILFSPDDETAPSDETTLRRFIRAAHRHDMSAEIIGRDDFGRLGEFDALFIRATTQVNNYTYRFATRAAAEGLAVIDDPVSIVRCSNKVYQAEVMAMHDVPMPPTVIIHRDTVDTALEQLGTPMVLKQPDSSFSLGVVKVNDEEEYRRRVAELLEDSDLIVAQAFMPTDYDWRIGVLEGQPLYACRYHMAPRHWQIARHSEKGSTHYGRTETIAIEDAPPRVVQMALKAARLIGDGLYGVDLKQVGRKVVVIEINDNPNIDVGYEDKALKDELYNRIIESFIRRIERLREGVRRG